MLEGNAGAQRAVETGEREELRADLVVKSVGYRSVPADSGIPFDEHKSIVLHDRGCVVDE